MKSRVKLVRGDTWQRRWQIVSGPTRQPIDLTGAVARLQLRTTGDVLVLEANHDNGWITVDGPRGEIRLAVPYAISETLAPGEYVFDCEVTLPSDLRWTVEQAVLFVVADVTRD